jgi:hypothetical protein
MALAVAGPQRRQRGLTPAEPQDVRVQLMELRLAWR